MGSNPRSPALETGALQIRPLRLVGVVDRQNAILYTGCHTIHWCSRRRQAIMWCYCRSLKTCCYQVLITALIPPQVKCHMHRCMSWLIAPRSIDGLMVGAQPRITNMCVRILLSLMSITIRIYVYVLHTGIIYSIYTVYMYTGTHIYIYQYTYIGYIYIYTLFRDSGKIDIVVNINVIYTFYIYTIYK